MQSSRIVTVKNTRKRSRSKCETMLPGLHSNQIETLRNARHIFQKFHIHHALTSQSLLRPSMFERLVSSILMNQYLGARSMSLPVRELELRLNIPFLLRKILDGTYSMHQCLSNPLVTSDELCVRYDFVWTDRRFQCLRIIEVDGEQHVSRNALFDKQDGNFEHRQRRDAVKTFICRLLYPRVLLMRIGPRLRRATHRRDIIEQEICAWCTKDPRECPPVCCVGFDRVRGQSALCLFDARTRRMLKDSLRIVRSETRVPFSFEH